MKGQEIPIGIRADTSAPRSVIGLKELNLLQNQLEIRNIKGKPSQHDFKFPNATYSSLGSVVLPLYTPPGVLTIYAKLEIVPADVPTLLGLDVLDSHLLNVEKVLIYLQKMGESKMKMEELSM